MTKELEALEAAIKAAQTGFYDKNGKHYVSNNQDIEIRLNLDENLYYAILEVYEVKSYTPFTLVLTENFWVSDYQTTWWLKKDKSE